MPEQIISADGNQYGLVINSDGSINISGVDISIGSLALSLENVYVQSGDNINLGNAWKQIGSVYVSNEIQVSGLENTVPGSQVWVQNPVGISGTEDIGSVVIKSAPLLGVSGNVIVTANNLDIRDLTSISDSIGVIGSVRISAPPLGISGTKLDNLKIVNQVAGSIVYLPEVSASGIMRISDLSGGTLYLAGSPNYVVPISGTVGVEFSNDYVYVIQSGTEWHISGAVSQTGIWDINNLTTGSVRVVSQANLDRTISNRVAGSIVDMPTTTVTATDFDIRNLSSTNDSIRVVGSVRISAPPLGVSGTVFTNGNITGSMVTKGIGSIIIKSAPLIGVSGAIFDSGNITGSAVISSSVKLGVSGIVEVSGITHDFTTMYKQYIDYQGTYQPVYIGLALPGTGSETTGWFLRKYLYENDLPIATLFGSGNTNFDKKWSDRSGTNEVYS